MVGVGRGTGMGLVVVVVVVGLVRVGRRVPVVLGRVWVLGGGKRGAGYATCAGPGRGVGGRRGGCGGLYIRGGKGIEDGADRTDNVELDYGAPEYAFLAKGSGSIETLKFYQEIGN